MIIPASKRVSQRADARGFRSGSYYASAIPGGPAGSALMTFFVVIRVLRTPDTAATRHLFGRSNIASAGWAIYSTSTPSLLVVAAANSTPTFVFPPTVAIGDYVGQTLIIVGRYNNGTMQGWINGVSMGTSTVGAGYTPNATATEIGGRVNVDPAKDMTVLEAGMLDGFDIASTIATVNGQWQEDLQQGRYLTWPRAMTVSDWYWSARDAASGLGGTKATWVDRGPNAVVLNRVGNPQSGATPMVF